MNKENGHLDEAIEDFERVLATGPSEAARARHSISARDYEVINELGQALFERAKVERGPSAEAGRRAVPAEGGRAFERTLAARLRKRDRALRPQPDLRSTRGLRRRPRTTPRCTPATSPTTSRADRVDRDRIVLANPAANHAAQSIVIYDRCASTRLTPIDSALVDRSRPSHRHRGLTHRGRCWIARAGSVAREAATSAALYRRLPLPAAAAANRRVRRHHQGGRDYASRTTTAPREKAAARDDGRRRRLPRLRQRRRPGPAASSTRGRGHPRGQGTSRPPARRSLLPQRRPADTSRTSRPVRPGRATSTAWASPSATTTTTADRPLRHRRRRQTTCSATTADTFRDVTAGGRRRRPRPTAGARAPRGSTTTTTATSTCSSATTSTGRREIDLPAGLPALAGIGRAYGPPTQLRRVLSLPLSQRRRRPVHRRARARRRPGHEPATQRAGRQVARRRARRRRRRRLVDLVVANDTVQNFLFHNRRTARSRRSARRGRGLRHHGNARAGDGHRRGRLPQRRLARPGHRQLRQRDDGALRARSDEPAAVLRQAIAAGLGPASRGSLKFGLFFFDYDLDGRLDLLSANGHLEARSPRCRPARQYEQPAQLFWNTGRRAARPVRRRSTATRPARPVRPIVGRGARLRRHRRRRRPRCRADCREGTSTAAAQRSAAGTSLAASFASRHAVQP